MAVTNYYSVGGEILGESNSGSRTDYLRDALGSVTGTVDATGVAKRSYSYKPYGSPLATSGSGADPLFRWVGSQGYRSTGLPHSSHYVRMRHYGQEEGRWTTIDPLSYFILSKSIPITEIGEFLYASGNPTTFIDPSGLLSYDPTWPYQNPYDPSNPYPQGPITVTGGLSNCLTISLAIPFPGWFEDLSVSFTFCKTSYDTACCVLPVASTCITAQLNLSVKIAAPSISAIDDLERDVRTAAAMINGIFGGLFNIGVLGSIQEVGCPQPGRSYHVNVCLVACAGLFSVQLCAGTDGVTVKDRVGYCGFPSIDISLQGSIKNCS